MQRWNVIQHELLTELRNEVGVLTPKLEKVIHTLEELAQSGLAPRVHEALIKGYLGSELIGPISRDGTAIEEREHPVRTKTKTTAVKPVKKRGPPRRGAARAPAKESPVHRQREQPLAHMLREILRACGCGTMCNAQG